MINSSQLFQRLFIKCNKQQLARNVSTTNRCSAIQSTTNIFDGNAKRMQKERAARK